MIHSQLKASWLSKVHKLSYVSTSYLTVVLITELFVSCSWLSKLEAKSKRDAILHSLLIHLISIKLLNITIHGWICSYLDEFIYITYFDFISLIYFISVVIFKIWKYINYSVFRKETSFEDLHYMFIQFNP